MKVVIAVHHFPPTYVAGAERRAHRTAVALRERGHAVRVVCIERIDVAGPLPISWDDTTYDGIAVRRLAVDMRAAPDPTRWEYDNPWIGDAVDAVFDDERPDVFHLFGGYLLTARPLRVAAARAIPTVVSLTDFWFLCPRITLLRSDGTLSMPPLDPVRCARCRGEEQRRYRLPGRWVPGVMTAFWRRRTGRVRAVQARTAFLRDTLNRVDVALSESQFVRDVHAAAGIDVFRLRVCRQGIDIGAAAAAAGRHDTGSPLRVGYLGQIAPHKGVHVLLEAVRQLPGAALTVTVCGDFSRDPRYTRRLRRLAGADRRVRLGPAFWGAQVGAVLAELDVIVVPSIWYENSPNVILEALAHRTPVIASALGGMAELVHDGENGLLFAPANATSLAQILRRVSDEPALLARLRAGIGAVKGMPAEIDELEAVYRDVIQTGDRRGGPAQP